MYLWGWQNLCGPLVLQIIEPTVGEKTVPSEAGAILLPNGHSVISRDIFICHNWGRGRWIQWVEARHAAVHPIQDSPPQQTYVSPSGNSVEVETPCLRRSDFYIT